MDDVDSETGEITTIAPRVMPLEIATAVFQVKAGIQQLGFDERNEHSKYSYASVDKFYAALRPLEAKAGLEVILDEVSFDVRAGDSGKGWAFITYHIWLLHKSGVMWGPLRRHIALPVTGAQTFGAAESYIHKAFRRGFYMVPTGDKDGDEGAPRDDAPVVKSATRAYPAVATENKDKSVAMAIAARIRADISKAGSIEELNRVGIFGPMAKADREAIHAVPGGARVWDDFVDRDAQRRLDIEDLAVLSGEKRPP